MKLKYKLVDTNVVLAVYQTQQGCCNQSYMIVDDPLPTPQLCIASTVMNILS